MERNARRERIQGVPCQGALVLFGAAVPASEEMLLAAVAVQKEKSVQSAVLNLEGNLYTLGGKPITSPDAYGFWKVAIRHPDIPDTYFGTVFLRNAEIATSSWYEHCFVKDSRVYHRILNPRTGHPYPFAVKSVSLCNSALDTDILSTAFFLLENQKGGGTGAGYSAKELPIKRSCERFVRRIGC